MFLRDRVDAVPETIVEFRAAAEDKYWEALSLMTERYYGAGIYLMGYTAEMLLKGAYFSFRGERLTSDINPLLAPAWTAGVQTFPHLYSSNRRNYHNLDFWSRMIREDRRRCAASLPSYLDVELLSYTGKLHAIWSVDMRYRHDMATVSEAEEIFRAVTWLRSHYPILATK